MANNPKKVKDPTEVALSAIQEALNIDTGTDVSIRGDAKPTPATTTAFEQPSFDARPGADLPVFEPIVEPRLARRPANDTARPLGKSFRPSRKVDRLATSIRSPRCSAPSGSAAAHC